MDNDLAAAVKAELSRIGSSVDKGLGASKERIEALQARVFELEQKGARRSGTSASVSGHGPRLSQVADAVIAGRGNRTVIARWWRT